MSCPKFLFFPEIIGGDEGDRTPDLGIANAALCQTELRPHSVSDSKIASYYCQVSESDSYRSVSNRQKQRQLWSVFPFDSNFDTLHNCRVFCLKTALIFA